MKLSREVTGSHQRGLRRGQSCGNPFGDIVAAAVFTACCMTFSGSAWAEIPSREEMNRPAGGLPAEELRLPQAEFREGLKRRGLTEILEQHIREFPPAGTTAAMLLLRDVKLAEASDAGRPADRRREALAEANRILEQVIEREPADPRRFTWRFTLAHSLIYGEAEPYTTFLLCTDGSREDRELLRARTLRARRALENLPDDIDAEYRRMDAMNASEFEALERGGYVDEIDRLSPRASYLLLWTLFYDGLAREDLDTGRVETLSRVVDLLQAQPALLAAAHSVSGVQLQSLLLAGMSQRRLRNHTSARESLEKAIGVAERIENIDESQRVAWATRLAWIEKIRLERDEAKFDDARTSLDRLRGLVATTDPDALRFWNVIVGLLERSILRDRADAAERAGRGAEAAALREEAWKALSRVAAVDEAHRRELYAILRRTLGPDAARVRLDPVETCAVLAGLIAEAEQSPESADALLSRAVEVGSAFRGRAAGAAATLLPEVLYNLGVAEYRRGRRVEAAEVFTEVAGSHPTFPLAGQAATLAVQILSGGKEPESQSEEHARRYLAALETLVRGFPSLEESRYYQFFYAQSLADVGEYDRAAAQFLLVVPDHVHYVESRFLRLRCLADSLTRTTGGRDADPLEIRRRLNELLSAQREFVSFATDLLSRTRDSAGQESIRRVLAGSKLILAEVLILPSVDRFAQALETLDGWETHAPQDSGWLGRVLRVRIIACERLGRLDDAAGAIPEYLAADPIGAGPTLQSLFTALSAEAELLRKANDETAARLKSETAMVVAQEVEKWVSLNPDRVSSSDRKALRLQLAEAHLQAGHLDAARTLFTELRRLESADAEPGGSRPSDPRIAFGYAETLYRLGELEDALPLFNRLATGLRPADPMRWKALLRDLQCRTALGHPPSGIIKVIQQQKYLYPELGGPEVAGQLLHLLRENERRVEK